VSGNLLTVLPLAFVMIAGPQIISAVFFATSHNWKGNSAAYIGGAALSITSLFTIAYFVVKGLKSGGSSHKRSGSETIDWVVLGLLVVLAVRVFLQRNKAEPPKWMGKLETATPKFSFTLGFLLLGVFPTDILTSITVGSRLAGHGDPWWHGLGFVLVTLFFLAIPVLLVLVLGKRAEVFLPKVRDWMNTNSWIVSEIVIVFFIVITINSLASSGG
jgi:threonine/homoserine/homoserine lactone efflux protein